MKEINPRIRWDKRRGTAKQAADYCTEDGDFAQWGERSCQGKRSDIEDATDLIDEGRSVAEVASANPCVFVKYHKGLLAYKYTISQNRCSQPIVNWRWGLTGTGKTRYCIEKHPSHYIKDGSKWWDGYEGQEAIIIDDFDGAWPFRDLLRLLDRYIYQGQTKGGYVKINSPYIYITCEYPPSHFYHDNELKQLTRRINSVAEVVGNTNATTSKPNYGMEEII